ncbi:MAG: flotillin-like protein FloA [Lentisphaeria bacterium]|nr:flotillin-like protein FloA [Lentisphaeria bacterium]
MSTGLLILLIASIILLIIIFCVVIPIPLWIAAVFSGVRIKIASLVGMRLRRVPPSIILSAMIQAKKADLHDVTSDALEAHYLAGGHVLRVIFALVAADKARIPLTLQKATAIDLAGRDVLDAVKMSVNPRVIETPMVTAVAQDGIQLIAVARITVRANIDRLVGGAGEETILARVGEGIVTTIGSSDTHKKVLENPDMISKTVLSKGLDSGTAFEILSIDIADVDVGKNIGAELQMAQANADKEIAQAKAEERRSMAIAYEQEMRAKIREMEAKVVEAEAQVPQAISDALNSGRLGIMDYYNMKNIMADTDMRHSIAHPASSKQQGK